VPVFVVLWAGVWGWHGSHLDPTSGHKYGKSVVLRHQAAHSEKPKDVTTLDWSPDGELLASGSSRWHGTHLEQCWVGVPPPDTPPLCT